MKARSQSRWGGLFGRATAEPIQPIQPIQPIEPLIDPNEQPTGIIHLTRRTVDGQLQYLLDELAARIAAAAQAREETDRARAELVALRNEMADLDQLLTAERQCVAELQQALDHQRPAADPAVLGPLLRARWTVRGPQTEKWEAVAETAIDHIRGLWPLDPPSGDPESTGALT